MMQRGRSEIMLGIVIIVLIGIVGYWALEKKQNSFSGSEQVSFPNGSPADIENLIFNYGGETFNLQWVAYPPVTLKNSVLPARNVYEFRAGDTSTVRVYTFVPNSSADYAEGKLTGDYARAFILWRGSGANIIVPILFVFRKNGEKWNQTAYTNLPPDGGRTSIERFVIENESIVFDVKISGPDRNYHETYVPKHYVYELDGTQLRLQ